MARKKPNYVSSAKVMSMKGRYNFVIGAWSNGKSYAVKGGVVKECWKKDKKLAYIRRLMKEDSDTNAENYFLDCPVEQITDGEYTAIVCYRRILYFANYDKEKAKYIRGRELGRRFNLYEAYQTRSMVFQDYAFGIFEEVLTLDNYLPKESYRLQRLVSTISRTGNIKVYMIANTITPICPYYREWQLVNIPKMEFDQIDTYEIDSTVEEGKTESVKVQVYLTHPLDAHSNMIIGALAKEAHGGAFHCEEHNHLDCSINDCSIKYNMVICYEGQKMLMQFVRDKFGNYVWFVSPKTSEIQKGTRTIGQIRSNSMLHTNKLTPISDRERKAFDYLLSGKIAYSDNLTGTLFLQMLKGIGVEGFQYE